MGEPDDIPANGVEIAARAARPVDPDPPIARTRIGKRPRSRLINPIV